ncbi:hypothetical protein AABB24_016538 [Solanum stoloniferum]
MKIPPKFIKHMEGRASGTTILVDASGNSWPVDLIQQDDDLIFHNGWVSFVKYHCLETGDSLVFRYDSDLHFTVQVSDDIPSECISRQDTHGLASSKDGYTPEDAVCSYAGRNKALRSTSLES